MRQPVTERDARSGYILVAVLSVMLILSGFVAAASLLVRSTLDTARVEGEGLPMIGLAQSGLELTAYQLFVIKAAPATISGRRLKFGGGTIVSRIQDEAGKADLNGSDLKLLAAVFQSAGLDSRTARDVLDFVTELRGPDTTAAPTDGAVASNVSQPSAKIKRRGLLSIDQLREVPDMTGADWRALKPFVTVYNPDGKINVLSASPEILTSIPGLSNADVSVILSRRQVTAKKAIEDLLSKRGESKSFLKTTFGPAFNVQIDAVSAAGRKKAINAVIATAKGPDDPYYVLDWRE